MARTPQTYSQFRRAVRAEWRADLDSRITNAEIARESAHACGTANWTGTLVEWADENYGATLPKNVARDWIRRVWLCPNRVGSWPWRGRRESAINRLDVADLTEATLKPK